MNCRKENKHFFHRARTTGRSTKERGNKGECNQADGLVWRILCRERWESCVTGVKLCLDIPLKPEDTIDSRRSSRFPTHAFLHCLTPSIHSGKNLLPWKVQHRPRLKSYALCLLYFLHLSWVRGENVRQDAWGITREVILLNDFTKFILLQLRPK